MISRFCAIALLCVAFQTVAAGIAMGAQNTPHTSPESAGAKLSPVGSGPPEASPVPLNLAVEPSVLVAGQQYTLLLRLSKDACDGLAKGKQTPLDALVEVKASSSDALTPGQPTKPVGQECSTTLPITVGKDAPAGELTLFLMGSAGTGNTAPILGMVPVTIQVQKGPGPIPAGLKPELDLMWKVLPRRAVADSFGNRVADGYFEVEAVFGNETGFDLQLSAVGFEVPQVYCLPAPEYANYTVDEVAKAAGVKEAEEKYTEDDKNKIKAERTTLEREDKQAETIRREDPSWDRCRVADGSDGVSTIKPPGKVNADPDKAILPVDAYPVVRGTVEREQSVGTRAFVVNLVKGASSVLVGVGGFYPDAGVFVRSTGVISGPFEKALELVYPDLTTNHLINLDSRTLRDGVIVPNNTSFRINAFISREIVQCNYPKHLLQFGFTPGASYNCLDGDGRLQWSRDFDPNQVMQRLGKLELIGRKIQYLERERVLTQTDNLPQSQGAPVLSEGSIVVDGTAGQTFSLPGTNLHGATLTSLTSCLKVTTQSVSNDETSLGFTLDSSKCTSKDIPQLQVGSTHGFFLLNASLVSPQPAAKADAAAAALKP